MPTLDQVRQAIVDTVKANVATEMYLAKDILDVTDLPAMMVKPVSADFSVTMGKTTTHHLYLYIMCSRSDTALGEEQLDGFIDRSGTNSIPAAINDHSDLGLAKTDAMVMSMHGYGGSFVDAGIPHVGAILKVKVEVDP